MYGTNGNISVIAVCPSCEVDLSSLRELLVVVILYYFCGALDNLVSGHKNPHSIRSSYCITSVGLWTTWSQVTRIHIVYTYVNKVACDGCWRVCPSTGMLQNFSAMNLGVRTVV